MWKGCLVAVQSGWRGEGRTRPGWGSWCFGGGLGRSSWGRWTEQEWTGAVGGVASASCPAVSGRPVRWQPLAGCGAPSPVTSQLPLPSLVLQLSPPCGPLSEPQDCPARPLMLSLLSSPQSSLMDLADVFTAPAPPPASDPWGGPGPMAAAVPTAAPTSDPWGGPPVPPAADPWGGPAPTPASGDPWRPAAPSGPPVDPWGGTQAPAAGEGPTPDPWGSSDGECQLPALAPRPGVPSWACRGDRGRHS